MRLLLDTQLFLWVLSDSRKLSRNARRAILGADTVSVSAASIWEATIKFGLGKLSAPAPVELLAAIATSGFRELPVTGAHAAQVATLPPIHRDPFDRLLVAQAMYEPLQLLTTDAMLARYSDIVVVV